MQIRNQEFNKQQIDRLFTNPRFLQDVSVVRKKWKIPPQGFSNKNSAQRRLNKMLADHSDNSKYVADCRVLLEKYGNRISFNHLFSLFEYTYMLNNRIPLLSVCNAGYKREVNLRTREVELTVQIYPETRKKDLDYLWKFIRRDQKKLNKPVKKQRLSNPLLIERDTFIYKYHLQGSTASQIADLVSKEFAESALSEDEKTPDQDTIYKVIQRKKSDI